MRPFRRVATYLLASSVLFLASAAGETTRRIWIDTDLSFGSPIREVDDAYALVLAHHSPELEIVGISTTYGNAPLRATTRRTLDLLRRLGLTMPVAPGASSPNDLGRTTNATETLAAALRQDDRLTYIALGPLTNLATFLQLHPQEAAGLDQIIMVAGHSPDAQLGFGPKGKFQIHDANVVKDPGAVRIVLAADVPLLIAPIETSSDLMLEGPDLEFLQKSGPLGRHLAKGSRVWLWFWQHIARARGGPCFDALAIVAAARPQALTLETRQAVLSAQGQLLVRPGPPEEGRKVRFCLAFAPGTKEFFLRRLSGRPAKSSNARRDR